MAKNPVLHRQIARRRLLARRLLPNASSRKLWQRSGKAPAKAPSCYCPSPLPFGPPFFGSLPTLFGASRRRYSTSARGIASCDSVATCMRHYVTSHPDTRYAGHIGGGRALTLSFPPSVSLVIQRWTVLTDKPPTLASSAAAGDPSRSMIDATRSLISSRPDPATYHATGTLARNTASVLRCLLYSSLDGEIAA